MLNHAWRCETRAPRRSRPMRYVATLWMARLAMVALGCIVFAAWAQPSSDPLQQARAHYQRGAFEPVRAMLEPLATARADAELLLLLGKAYGRLAERAPWYRAIGLATQCGHYLERAVAADEKHVQALQALLKFHEQAPALVGGNRSRAQRLRARLRALNQAP